MKSGEDDLALVSSEFPGESCPDKIPKAGGESYRSWNTDRWSVDIRGA